MTKDIIKTALTVDDTLLSRMLSVAENVPEAIFDAVGSAKGVGRDRWEDVKSWLPTLPAPTGRLSLSVAMDLEPFQPKGALMPSSSN